MPSAQGSRFGIALAADRVARAAELDLARLVHAEAAVAEAPHVEALGVGRERRRRLGNDAARFEERAGASVGRRVGHADPPAAVRCNSGRGWGQPRAGSLHHGARVRNSRSGTTPARAGGWLSSSRRGEPATSRAPPSGKRTLPSPSVRMTERPVDRLRGALCTAGDAEEAQSRTGAPGPAGRPHRFRYGRGLGGGGEHRRAGRRGSERRAGLALPPARHNAHPPQHGRNRARVRPICAVSHPGGSDRRLPGAA